MTYPQLTEGIAVAQVPDGCVIMGGPQRELFTGRAAREVFPRLLPLLDGTRAVDDVATTLGIPAVHIRRVVDLLRERSLLHIRREPGGSGHRPAEGPMPTFLRRCVPDGQGEQVWRRLQAARVRVTGSTPLGTLIADLLARSGVGTVEHQPGPVPEAPARDLVITVTGPDPASEAPAGPAGSPPWLPVQVVSGECRVGPLLNVPGAVCTQCRSADLDDAAPVDPEPAGEAALTGVAAGVAAGVALRYLAGYGTPARAGGVLQRIGQVGPPREQQVSRRPGCPACGLPAPVVAEPALAELDDELLAGAPSGGWDLDRLDPSAPARQILARPYLTEPRLAAHGRAGGERPGMSALARLLARGVGTVRRHRRDGRPAGARWAPSAAAAGSTHAYVLGDLDGGGHTVHYFDGGTHEFVRLPGRAPEANPAGALSVVLTGDLAVLSPEFTQASRRVAYQDAGLALAQLHSCAAAAGWRVRARPDPPGDLAELLELEPEREVIAAIVDVAEEPAGAGPVATRWHSRRLGRTSMTYQFAGRPVAAGLVARVADSCLSGVAAHWESAPAPELSCLLYARRVGDLSPGLYRMAAGSPPEPVTAVGASLAPIDAYLQDRGSDPPALLLFTGHLPGALAAHGPTAYPALVVKAAAAGGLAHAAATRAGLGSGLVARAPAGLVSAALDDRADRHRVFYGCAIGHPRPEQFPTRPERAIW